MRRCPACARAACKVDATFEGGGRTAAGLLLLVLLVVQVCDEVLVIVGLAAHHTTQDQVACIAMCLRQPMAKHTITD